MGKQLNVQGKTTPKSYRSLSDKSWTPCVHTEDILKQKHTLHSFKSPYSSCLILPILGVRTSHYVGHRMGGVKTIRMSHSCHWLCVITWESWEKKKTMEMWFQCCATNKWGYFVNLKCVTCFSAFTFFFYYFFNVGGYWLADILT